jgi:hypothetical protein
MKESTEYTVQQILIHVKHIVVLANAALALWFLDYAVGLVHKMFTWLF